VTDVGLVERPVMPPPAFRRTQTRAADLAWAAHRNEPVDRVPPEISREARNFRRSLEPAAKAIIKVLHDRKWRPAADVYLKRGVLGSVRERAFDELKRRFHPAVVESCSLGALGQTVTISFLSGHGGLGLKSDDPSFAQPGAAVYVIAVMRFRRELVLTEMASVEFPLHCLARMFQREPGIDVSGSLMAAAALFMRLPIRKLVGLSFSDETIILPASGGGVFLSELIAMEVPARGLKVYAHARTFVSEALRKPDQVGLEPAADPGATMLATGWALSGKLKGVSSPLSEDEIKRLKFNRVEEESRK